MTDREQILASLHKQERAVKHPPAWETRRHFEDLAERFTTSLTAGAGEVHRAASLAEALEILGQLLAELPARKVAVNAEPPLDGIDLAACWPNVEWHVTGQSRATYAPSAQPPTPASPASMLRWPRPARSSSAAGRAEAGWCRCCRRCTLPWYRSPA